MPNYTFTSLCQTFGFGKYENFSLKEVLDSNPSYVTWCIDNISNFCMTPDLIDEVKAKYADFNISEEFESRYSIVQDENVPDEFDQEIDNDYDDYESHYDEFAGSYAQDVMGYSDEDIYDIFDGEPDAYWNID